MWFWICGKTQPILAQCSISIPPENVRKLKVLHQKFSDVSGGEEIKHRANGTLNYTQNKDKS